MRFLRWIEEAEARRHRERAVLEPDASGLQAATPPATAVVQPRPQTPRSKTRPQTNRDGSDGGDLSYLTPNSGN
jgi:hypothetical protein